MASFWSITQIIKTGERIKAAWPALGLSMPQMPAGHMEQLWGHASSPKFALSPLAQLAARRATRQGHQKQHLALQKQRLTQAAAMLSRLRRQYKQDLEQTASHYARICQNLARQEADRHALAEQAPRLHADILQIKAAWPSHTVIYKDKLKQALNQAKELKETLAAIDTRIESGRQECSAVKKRLCVLQGNEAQYMKALRDKGLSLAASHKRLMADEAQLFEESRGFNSLNNLKQDIEDFLAQGSGIIAGWEAGRSPLASFQRMRQFLDEAKIKAGHVLRLQGLLKSLDIRLPKRIQALQVWHTRNKALAKEMEQLETELQALTAGLTAENYGQRAGLHFRLTSLKAKLELLLEQQCALDRQCLHLHQAVPRELERGKQWTELWRAAAKEERALLTQAAAWQQEALQEVGRYKERLQKLRPVWREQALHFMECLELWPVLLSKGEEFLVKETEASQREQALNTLVIPAPSVANLLKTPVSFKQCAAAWRRLQPGASQQTAIEAMRQSVDYWLNLLSHSFSEAIRQPLQRENSALSARLLQAEQKNQWFNQSRARTALWLRRMRHHKTAQQSETNRLAQIINDVTRELNQARQYNDNLENSLSYAQQECERQQEAISGLQLQSAAGGLARLEVERLQEKLNLLQRERQAERRRIEDLSHENSRLNAYKHKNEKLIGIVKQRIEQYKEAKLQIEDLAEQNSGFIRLNTENQSLKATIEHLTARGDEYRLRIEELEALGLNVERLEAALARAKRTIKALRGKALERHRLYRQSQQALAGFKEQQERNISLEVKLDHLKDRLEASQRELARLRGDYKEAIKDRDEARASLFRERSVRAGLTTQALQQQVAGQELEQARQDARYWSKLARELQDALQGAPGNREEVKRWQLEAARQAARIVELEGQLDQLSMLLSRQNQEQPHALVMSRQQTDRVLSNLQKARLKLKNAGRSVLHGWALIAVISGSLLLGMPTVSGTAVPANTAPFARELAITSDAAPAANSGRASARIIQPTLGLSLDFRPPRAQQAPLPQWMERYIVSLARHTGLSQTSLQIMAEALWLTRAGDSLESLQNELAGLAWELKIILEASPHIAGELGINGPSTEPLPGQIFNERLFNEYRALGYSPAEALGALGCNLWAEKQAMRLLATPASYAGRVRPIDKVESLTLPQFVDTIGPYIENKIKSFMRERGKITPEFAARYARDLATDIYCAADKFGVPRTFMLAIAHQETFYSNVLGDSRRSASPFQIFAPTKKIIIEALASYGFAAPPSSIRLERHLTLSTYMAAFHLRQLMHRCGSGGAVDSERLLRMYNGGEVYIGLVAKRQAQLAAFLASK